MTVAVRPLLVDTRGRVADDLRISVTDRCDFRCVYCMPAEGLRWLPRAEVLTLAEIVRLASLLVDAGVRTIRLTGGEPLVRRDLPELIAALHAIDPGLDISLTTNGYLLERRAAALHAAGLRRVNVSLDSLRADRFERLTRRNALDQVLRGIDAARAAGLSPVKVNVVVIRGVNDDEVGDFARFARERDVAVRFIEWMPLDASGEWTAEAVVAGDELLDAAEAEFPLVAVDNGHDPATRRRFADGAPGELGVIPTVSAPFCARCNRIRLTADGQFRTCLFSVEETDLRTPMRAGASDDELLQLVRDSVHGKWAGHNIGSATFVRPTRSMSQIGG